MQPAPERIERGFSRLAFVLGFCVLSSAFAEELELNVATGHPPGFRKLEHCGVAFSNRLGEEQIAANRVLETGSGAAAGDYDGDGLADLFFASLSGQCRLYRNLGGLRFADATASSGIDCAGAVCRGGVFADLDGDRDLDLLVSTTGQGIVCFRNEGSGRFVNDTRRAGTASPFASMTLTLADVDRNGTLDLYVANYRTNDIRDTGELQIQSVGGQLVIPAHLRNRFTLVDGAVQEFGEPDLLYLNDGTGRFTPQSWIQGRFKDERGSALKHAPFDWGLGAAFRDLNGDLAPDLYVCNDYWTPDRIWINDGRGGFRAASSLEFRKTSNSSMGVDFADIDRDGQTDVYVVDMISRRRAERLRQMPTSMDAPAAVGDIAAQPQVNRNTLCLNLGDGEFAEIAELAGLDASGWSWQPLFLDVDLDGYQDVLIPSGHTKDVQDYDVTERHRKERKPWKKQNGLVEYHGQLMPQQTAFTRERLRQLREYPDRPGPIAAFRNTGQLVFEDATASWGFGSLGIHHGVAPGDLDNDGDLDFIVNKLNAPAEVWVNVGGAPRVAVELIGAAPNTAGIGARVTLFGGAVPVQADEMTAGGKYLSGGQARLVFAAGSSSAGMSIEVLWPSGARSLVTAVAPNRLYRIHEVKE